MQFQNYIVCFLLFFITPIAYTLIYMEFVAIVSRVAWEVIHDSCVPIHLTGGKGGDT